MRKFLEVKIGDQFGRLTVCKFAGRNPIGRPLWKCDCECGKSKIVLQTNLTLKSRPTRSCGCLIDEARHKKATHGRSKTRLYYSWLHMRSRCEKPQNPKYPRYGGRGIKVCDRWKKFENFLADMGEKPTSSHTLDRKDSNGNYEPGNCRWASQVTQQRNRTNNIKVDYQGTMVTLDELSIMLGVQKHTLYARYSGRSAVDLFAKGRAKKKPRPYICKSAE